jgi:hypothetical protein
VTTHLRYSKLFISGMAVLATQLIACGGDPGLDFATTGAGDFESFKSSLPRAEGGYVVEGDLLIRSDELLRAYHEEQTSNALMIDTISGADNKFSPSVAAKLSYCVSKDFGQFRATVVAAMSSATTAWQNAAAMPGQTSPIKFVYDATQDDAALCTGLNTNVVFAVRPSTSTQWSGFSFLPSWEGQRDLFFSSLALFPTAPKTFVGIAMHELGHSLGMTHEHMRSPSSTGNCLERSNPDALDWRGITAYDSTSVMHYQNPVDTGTACASSGARDHTISPSDAAAMRCIYNPAVNACKGPRLSTAARAFSAGNASYAATSDGVVFRIRADNTGIERYVPATPTAVATWTAVGASVTDTRSIFAGGSKLYRVTTGNRVLRWTGAAWTDFGDAGKAAVAGYFSGDLFKVSSTGVITRVAATGSAWETLLATSDANRKLVAGATGVYRIDGTGAISRWTGGTTWSSLGGNFVSAAETAKAIGTANVLYALQSNGVVQRWTGTAWTRVGEAGAPAVASLWGGLNTLYVSPSATPSSVSRLDTTSFVPYLSGVSQLVGAGLRGLEVAVEAGSTAVYDLYFPR